MKLSFFFFFLFVLKNGVSFGLKEKKGNLILTLNFSSLKKRKFFFFLEYLKIFQNDLKNKKFFF